MIPDPSRPAFPAVPGMMVLSLVLHGAFLGLVVLFSTSLKSKPLLNEELVRGLKIVHSYELPTRAIKMPTAEANVSKKQIKNRVVKKTTAVEQPNTRKTVESSMTAAPRAATKIPLKKRRRSLKRVKIASKKKPERSRKAVKKKKDPQEILQQRLAEIRKQLKHQADEKKQALNRDNSQTVSHDTQAGFGPRGRLMDPEMLRWLAQVRTRVKAHWSVLRQRFGQDLMTVIGVNINEDGTLIDAAVSRSSGDRFFDLAAMRAIHQAAPFPRLPGMMKESDGKSGGLTLRFASSGLQ